MDPRDQVRTQRLRVDVLDATRQGTGRISVLINRREEPRGIM